MNPINWNFPSQSQSRPTVPSLSNAISALLTAKTAAGCRKRYLVGLRQYLTAFARGREDLPIDAIGVEDLERWFAERSESLVTRASNVGRLGSLFGYAVRRGWIVSNPCARLERVRLEQRAPRILSPEEAAQLMAWIAQNRPRCLAWFALALYAGVRPEEGYKLKWSNVNLEAGSLVIDAATSKVRHRRIVHLRPIAADWLSRAAAMDALLPVSFSTIKRARIAACKALRWEWDQDILRHTAASYLLAHHQDAGRVARSLGNSAGILLRHYTELVTRSESRRFWGEAGEPPPIAEAA